jgi:hypothetical protein
MVGAVRFELTTSWTRTKRASQTTLRPDAEAKIYPLRNRKAMPILSPRKANRIFLPENLRAPE